MLVKPMTLAGIARIVLGVVALPSRRWPTPATKDPADRRQPVQQGRERDACAMRSFQGEGFMPNFTNGLLQTHQPRRVDRRDLVDFAFAQAAFVEHAEIHSK